MTQPTRIFRSAQNWAFLASATAATLFMLSGCSSDESNFVFGERAFSIESGTEASMLESGPCTQGATQACSVTLSQENGVLSCYHGTQSCKSGKWSSCVNGETRTEVAPDSNSDFDLSSINVSIVCVNNPCDPSCRAFDGPAVVAGTGGSGTGGSGAGSPLFPGFPGDPAFPNDNCESGLDCQTNFHCIEPQTDASCTHSKCLAGAKLDGTCKNDDECVARICASDSACCDTEWTAACVAKVETLCDAECGIPTPSACHDVCNVGSKMAKSCNTCVKDVCDEPTYAGCCTGAWDSTCVKAAAVICDPGSGYTGGPIPGGAVPAKPEDSLCNFAVLMGSGSADIVASSTITGDLAVLNGALNIASSPGTVTRVDGTVYASGNIGASGSNITGGTLPFRNGIHNPALGTSLEVRPMATCGMSETVSAGSPLQLNGGSTYQFDNLTIEPGGVVEVVGTGRVIVNVCNTLKFDSNLGPSPHIATAVPSGKPLDLEFFSNGVVDIGNFVEITGILRAKSSLLIGTTTPAYVTINGFVHIYGGVSKILAETTINAGSVDFDECIAAGVDPNYPPSATCTIPYTPTFGPPPESGECVDNSSTHQVDTDYCAESDLSVTQPNCRIFTVCNHGNTTVPADEAELNFYPMAAKEFASDFPDAAQVDSTCLITKEIPAGSCMDQDCPGLSQDLTFTVNLTAGASVTECSILDNWSYYEDGAGCPVPPVPSATEFVFESSCTDKATSPYWGLIKWNAQTPGASTTVFEARVADTEAAFSGGSAPAYLPMGTAEMVPAIVADPTATPPVLAAPANYSPRGYFDLTAGLWATPPTTQENFLQIRVTPNSAGSDIPSLDNWQVTYSCIVDQ